MRARLLLAAVAGLGLAAAFEPLAWWWLLVPAVAGFAVATRGARVRDGWWTGLVFGIAFYVTHIWWMRAVSTGAWIALAGVEALFYGLLGAAVVVLGRRRGVLLTAPCAWVTMETVRSGFPFSGMPWGRLAFASADTPAMPALGWVGMAGVSLLLAGLGWALAGLLAPVAGGWRGTLRARAPYAGSFAAVVVLLALAGWQPASVTASGSLQVAAVQPDVPGPGNDILYDFRQVTDNLVTGTRDLAARVATGESPRPDLVVWPENSTAIDPFTDQRTNQAIRAGVAAIGVPVLVGGIVDDGPRFILNQGIVWSPITGAGERYTKRHPVPFGEYLPFRSLVGDVNFGQLSRIQADMLAGTRTTPLMVAGTPVADAICFDVAYDDVITEQVAAGAELVSVQTSNATFIFTDQIDQQFAITRLRAVETGRWVVVASTNGVSGVVDPSGHVVSALTPRTLAVLEARVGLSRTLTPGVRLGPWVTRGAAAVSALGLALGLLTGRVRSRRVSYGRTRSTQPRERTET